MKNQSTKKTIAYVLGLVALVGTYNAVVINSDSQLDSKDAKFVKRLDEVYGVTTPGRSIAAAVKWQKLSKSEVKKVAVREIAPQKKVEVAAQDSVAPSYAEAALQETLNLSLAEVAHPKWKENQKNLSGSLSTHNGSIESLSVSLPSGESINVNYAEMSGNVFSYEQNGETFSGMMYQVDTTTYMVTLTNGPFEGTRMRFTTDASVEDQQNNQEFLAQNHNVEAGSFGEASAQNEEGKEVAAQNVNPQGFDFGEAAI